MNPEEITPSAASESSASTEVSEPQAAAEPTPAGVSAEPQAVEAAPADQPDAAEGDPSGGAESAVATSPQAADAPEAVPDPVEPEKALDIQPGDIVEVADLVLGVHGLLVVDQVDGTDVVAHFPDAEHRLVRLAGASVVRAYRAV